MGCIYSCVSCPFSPSAQFLLFCLSSPAWSLANMEYHCLYRWERKSWTQSLRFNQLDCWRGYFTRLLPTNLCHLYRPLSRIWLKKNWAVSSIPSVCSCQRCLTIPPFIVTLWLCSSVPVSVVRWKPALFRVCFLTQHSVESFSLSRKKTLLV